MQHVNEPPGIRTNNPGNLENNGTPWEGLADDQSAGGRFCVFMQPKWGIRAIARCLITYQDQRRAKDGSRIDTVKEIIDRWAPPTENDTDSYAAHVRQRLDLVEGQKVSVKDFGTMFTLVETIILHENGKQPYPEHVIREGLMLAGIAPVKKDLAQSKTIGAGKAGIGVAAAGTVHEMIPDGTLDKALEYLPYLSYLSTYKWQVIAAAMAGVVGYMIWRRISDNKVRFG